MKINKSIETPEGEVVFEGTLSADELDLIIAVGLNLLLQQGAVPFKVLREADAAKLTKGSEELQ